MFRADAAKFQSRLLLPVLSACALVSVQSAHAIPGSQAKKSRQVRAWVLRQEARAFGEQIVTLTDNALRIDSPRRGVYTVSVAPFKKVYMVNELHKTYYETGADQPQGFVMQRMFRVIGMDPKKEKWVRKKEGTIAGIKAGLYKSPESMDMLERKAAEMGSKLLFNLKKDGFWLAEDPELPTRASAVLCDLNGLPDLGKVPLQFKYLVGRRERVMLDTRSVTRSTVDASSFDIPRGYKKVTSEYNTSRTDMTIFSNPLGSQLP